MAASDDLLGQVASLRDHTALIPDATARVRGSDMLLDKMAQEQKRRSATVLDLVAPVDPDRAANAKKLADRFKLAPETIESKYEDFERVARIQDAQKILEASPFLRRQMSDPEFAKLAQDDLESLSLIEETLAFGANAARSTAAGLIPGVNAGLWGVAQAAADVAAGAIQPAVGRILPGNPFLAMSNKFSELRKEQEGVADRWRGEQKGMGFVQKSALSGFESLGTSGPMMVASVLSANPAPMLYGLSGVTAGKSYGEARDKNIPVLTSLGFASSQGLIEYATEKIPAIYLLRDVGLKKSFGKVLANQLMTEIPGEQVATILQDLNDWAVLNPDQPFQAYLDERPSAAAQTLIATMVATGGQVSIARVADRAANGPREQRNVELLTALKDGVANSKTMERAPTQVKAFIEKQTANGPIETIFIPAEQFARYFQSAGIDPAAAAAEMGAKNFGEAMTAGSDVVIPMADFITSVAKTPHYDALLPDIRFSQGEMTQREAQLWEANHPDEMARLIEQARGFAPAAQNPAVAQIEIDIAGQLVASGMEQGTAATYAQMYAKTIANLAERSGRDPLELHQQYGLTIDRPLPDILTSPNRSDVQIDPFLDRMRAGELPTDAEIFGPSLIEFIRELGGMKDDGGELRRMEVDADRAPFVRNLIQEGGRAIDEILDAVKQAGYQVDDIFEAIDNELRGNPVYSPANQDEYLLGLRETVNQLGEYLQILGVDLNAMSNEEVRQVMEQAVGNLYDQEGLQTLYQSATRFTDARLRPDLPLTDQTDAVRYALRGEIKRLRAEAWNANEADPDYAPERMTGEQLVERITERLGSRAEASAYLSALGVTEVEAEAVLYQDPTRLNDDRSTMRGYIQFGADRKFNIALLERADLSTFLHESGHFWLEVLGDLAEDANATEQIRADYAAILKFLDVESRAQIGVEQHELFARANEAYLREGKAPSPELRGIFAKFKAWLEVVYRALEQLNVTLNDEVRGVFDRIYASDAEIEAAQNEADLPQLFATAADAGMTEQEFAAYAKSVATSMDRAKDELRAKLMRQYMREKTAWWNEELDKVRAEVAKEVDAQPVYQAFDALTKGELPDGTPFKLDRASLWEQFGKSYIKRIPRGYGEGRGAVYATDGKGIHHDMAAEMLGYSSGAELVEALVSMRPRKDLIEAEAKKRMVERHGDLMVDGTIADEAMAALHNEERANILRTELQAIRRKQNEVAPFVKVEAEKAKAQRREAIAATDIPPAAVFREAARGMIGQTQVRDIRPYGYLQAERRAARAAFEAMSKGNYQEAAIQKQRELLNHYLYQEATKALEQAEKILAYARKFTKGKKRTKFGKAGEVYLEQIDDLLDQYEFADVPKRDLIRREKLLQFVRDKGEEGEPVMIPDSVLIDAQRRNYKTLPYDHLQAVYDAIRNIEHLVDLKTKLLKVQAQRALDEVVAEAVATIEEHADKKETPVGTRTWLDSARELRDGYFAAHRKISSLLREMDGFKDDGFMWNTIMKPINDAANEKAVRMEEATEKVAALFAKLEKPGIANKLKGMGLLTKQYYPSLGRSFSKADILALALNYGNEGNRQRIRDGYGWTDEQVLAALDRLEANEWAFVQGMWDLIDSYWGEISAQDKRVNGIAPEKVERSGFILPSGRRIEGGYYPIKYDERHSVRSYQDRAKEEAERILKGAVARPGVDTGFTKDRAAKVVDRKIKLDLGVGLEHIDTVLQTLTHREMLIDVNRILGDSKVNGAILDRYGIEVYKALQEGIVDIAAGEVGARDAFEAGMGHLRAGVTVVGMGLNLTTALMQPLGITQSMVRIGPKWVGRGIVRFIGDAVHMENATRFVYEKSPMMRLRAKTQNREIAEIRNKIHKGGVKPALDASYFYAIVKLQAVVDVPTWLGAYEKFMEQTGNDEAKAIALADQAVIDAQGGGQVKDLASVQRGGPLKKLFTTFYSYFSATWNLTVESTKRTDFKKIDDVGRFMVDMLLLYSLPVVLTALLKQAVKGGEGPDDDESWWAWLAREHLGFALGGLVGPREISSVIAGGFGYTGPAGTRFFAELGKFAQQASQGEVDEALLRAGNNSLGILFHYPAGQLQRTIEGFLALKDGSTSNPAVLIFGPRRDE